MDLQRVSGRRRSLSSAKESAALSRRPPTPTRSRRRASPSSATAKARRQGVAGAARGDPTKTDKRGAPASASTSVRNAARSRCTPSAEHALDRAARPARRRDDLTMPARRAVARREASGHARHRGDRSDLPRARLHDRAPVPRPRRSGTTSARSTFRRTIRRWTCTTRCTSRAAALLRTHTSPVQIRTLQTYPPPIRVLVPGNVYRRDFFDASHAPAFAQIEGLCVDEGISFVDLKATLTRFAERVSSARRARAFARRYFPFTEPSAEMDVQCGVCGGVGCAVCKGTGWIEILGSGMVHPVGARSGRRRQRALHGLGVRHGAGAHRASVATAFPTSGSSTIPTCASSSSSRE